MQRGCCTICFISIIIFVVIKTLWSHAAAVPTRPSGSDGIIHIQRAVEPKVFFRHRSYLKPELTSDHLLAVSP